MLQLKLYHLLNQHNLDQVNYDTVCFELLSNNPIQIFQHLKVVARTTSTVANHAFHGPGSVIRTQTAWMAVMSTMTCANTVRTAETS